MSRSQLISPGACIAIALSAKRFGAARITGKTKFGPTLELLADPEYASDARAWTTRLERLRLGGTLR